MPAGRGEEERFAAGVEYGSIPVFAGAGDDGTEDLARELELVARLRSAGPALSPTPAARNRAKERLMAAFAAQHASAQHASGQDVSGQDVSGQDVSGQDVSGQHGTDTGPVAVIAPVAVAEPMEAPVAEPRRRARPGGRHAMPESEAPTQARSSAGSRVRPESRASTDLGEVRRLRRSRPERPGNRRAALLGAAAAAALVALAGTGTFASQDALPGDSLYQVKRVAESTGYALTFGEQAKARRHLEQAQRRLDEVEGMVTRDQATRASGATVDPAEQELVRSTMQEFDTDAHEGSRLLLSGATDPAQVDDVREWAAEQSARLSGLRSTIPAEDQDKADESLALLERLLGEAQAASQVACDPTVEACPPVADTQPVDGAEETEPGTAPGGAVQDAPQPRTNARGGGGGDPADGVPGDEQADDEPTSDGSADDEPSESSNRNRSGGSGGSGDAEPAGSGDLSVPLPLPAPVRVPSVAPGLPGVSLGG